MSNLFKSLGFLSKVWRRDNREAIPDIGWSVIVDHFECAIATEPPFSRMVFLLQSDLLEFLQLEEFSGCAFDFVPILRQVPAIIQPSEIREFMFENLLRGLIYQIGNGGPTFFLDIEKMIPTEASVLVQDILELRRAEIDAAVVPFTEDVGYVEGVWLTYYGYQIMCALDLKGLDIPLDDLDRVVSTMNGIGLDLKTLEVDQAPEFANPDRIPEALYQLLLAIARGNYRRFRPFAYHTSLSH